MACLVTLCICSGCSKSTNTGSATSTDISVKNSQVKEHGHKSAHGGSLNAIVTCENGHAEVKIEDSKLCMWLVGGGTDTVNSVRIPDKSISLNMKFGNQTKTLKLKAKPLLLAGEKIGNCSYFEGSMPELANIKEFAADSQITFKGKKVPLKIEYPKGYDPD